jgi:hypothetical protein
MFSMGASACLPELLCYKRYDKKVMALDLLRVCVMCIHIHSAL